MTRPYTKIRRADQQAETRERIIAAAVELHTEFGPARTTISQIAERAGVQRHTLYAHFPDDLSLHMACSGHVLTRDPPPDPAAWAGANDKTSQLEQGLAALYAWYGRNRQIHAVVLRDATYSDLVRDIVFRRFGPPMAAIADTLAAGLGAGAVAALALAMSFHTWQTLVIEQGRAPGEAVGMMVRMIVGPAELSAGPGAE
jgi:AcrR family transcriptional regulator